MDGSAFEAPAPEVRREILAEEVDLLARQDRLLKRSLTALAALSVATLATAGLAGWALTKERVHVYLAERDPAGLVRFVNLDARRNPDNAMIMAEIDHWLRKAREVTTSPPWNERMRSEAVSATAASDDDKDRLFDEGKGGAEAPWRSHGTGRRGPGVLPADRRRPHLAALVDREDHGPARHGHRSRGDAGPGDRGGCR